MYKSESKVAKSEGCHGDGWTLSAQQMDFIRTRPFVYNATAGSFLELLCLQRFWTWLAKLIPSSMAPCVLTCAGLVVNVVCCLVLISYSPDARIEAPSWAFVVCAIGIFVYQTLDALDGKQAIKCQNTQIEEMYDHSCDAISTVFMTLSLCVAMQLGTSYLMVLAFLGAMIAFFSTHWQNHVTHVMVFGRFDVTEGQFLMILVHLISAIYGPQVWQVPVINGMQLKYFVGLGTTVAMGTAVIRNAAIIFGQDTPLDQYIRLPRQQGPQIWNPVFPVIVLTAVSAVVYMAGDFHNSPIVFYMTFGFAFAKTTMKLVIANAVHSEVEKWDSALVAPLVLCCNTCITLLPSYTALLCAMVVSFMDFARYFTYASWDIKQALDLWIFTLKHPAGHPARRTGNLGFYINGLNNAQILNGKEEMIAKILPVLTHRYDAKTL